MNKEKIIYPITHVRNRNYKAFEENFDYYVKNHISSLRNSLIDAVRNDCKEFIKIAHDRGFDLSFRNGILISFAWSQGHVNVIDYLVDDLGVKVDFNQVLHLSLNVDSKYFDKLIGTVKLDDEKWVSIIRCCGYDYGENKKNYPLLCSILMKYPDSHKHFIKQFDMISYMLAHKQYEMFEMYIKLGGVIGADDYTGSIAKMILSTDHYTDEQYFDMGGVIPPVNEFSDSESLKRRVLGLRDKWLSWKTLKIREKNLESVDDSYKLLECLL